jgi:hypothetical protein
MVCSFEMQFVDKHDNTVPSSDNWRTKVSPIPTFLQDGDGLALPPFEEKDKGNLLMKGILYTILTATIGVLVGYVFSYLMRAPQESTMQALKSLVSESQTALASPKTPAAGKSGGVTPPAAAAPTTAAPAAAPTAPALPPAPGAQKPDDKPKDAAPANALAAVTAAAATPAPAAAPPAAKKPPVPQGPIFLKGTNPYGPPPLVEQDIFTSSTLLKVEYDPSAAAPDAPYEPNTVQTPTFNQLLQDPPSSIEEEPSPEPVFQVQLGAFSSRLNATQFANRLQEKGYQVNIYEGVGRNRGAWYFVRMHKMMDQTMALETAKNIHATEKFSPLVIQPADTDKQLR